MMKLQTERLTVRGEEMLGLKGNSERKNIIVLHMSISQNLFMRYHSL